MTLTALLLCLFCGVLLFVQFGSLWLAHWRFSRPVKPASADAPFITLARPLCGKDSFEALTLRSSFEQDYPHYEILFCVASHFDPVIPLVEQLMAEYPQQRARLLVGNDPVSSNPKINNLMKAMHLSHAEWIAMADSNLLLPRDYLRSLVSAASEESGLVSSPAIGINPQNIWGSVEAAMLNTYQARWQFLSDVIGKGFAQGKTLFWRRRVLEAGGGLAALGQELAEDVASTKLVRRAGMKVTLPPRPFAQPIGSRAFSAIWSRQLRWARIRRFGFLALFLPEIFLGAAPVAAAASWLVWQGVIGAGLPLAIMALWYAAEWNLARQLGWPHSLRDVLAMILRDLMLPAVWIWCWAGRSFVWRGNVLSAEEQLTPQHAHKE